MARSSAIVIAMFRKCEDGKVKNHLHRVFDEEFVEDVQKFPGEALDFISKQCVSMHGHRGECVEIWGRLWLGRMGGDFSVYVPQDVSHEALHLPDDLFIES